MPPPALETQASLKESIADRLEEARDRTLLLIEQLTDEQLNTVYSELLSPLAWDLGHIANFEELWLVQNLAGLEPLDGDLGRFYDAIENPRAERNELPILRGAELRDYMARVRERTLSVLEQVELEDPTDRLAYEGFAYELILAHEHQHNETMLQLLQLVDGYQLPFEPRPFEPDAGPDAAAIPAGSYLIGAAAEGFAYDNERPAHQVDLKAFEIERLPVSNGEFAEFVEESGAEPPMFWELTADGWITTRCGGAEPIDPRAPVIHVDYRAAETYARWAGSRLPSELEWEAAHRAGVLDGVGQVWEWTSSEFTGYPGFEAFPYPEYSEVFFGADYKVLRGGSWATRENVMRPSFRNWDRPIRSQIFAGFRCARNA